MTAPSSTARAPLPTLGRGRLARYVPYLLADYWWQGGVALVLIAFFVGGFPLIAETYGRPDGWLRGPEGQELAGRIIVALAGNVFFLGALLAANGTVSTDRNSGYFRFLFAKPLSVVGYYLTSWVVRGAGFALVIAILGVTWRLLAGPVSVAALAGSAALHYATLGALALLLSALVGRDWLYTAGIYIASRIAATFVEARGWTGARRTIADVLIPPFGRLEGTSAALLAGRALPDGALVHLLAFGTACVVLAIVVLRRRPLSP